MQTIAVYVTSITRIENTLFANPRYQVRWGNGTARTKPDADFANNMPTQLGWYDIDFNSRRQIIGMRKL